MKFPKIGSLVELYWLDASHYMYANDVSRKTMDQGGDILIASGYLVEVNKNGVALCAELNEKREPSRDVTIIPRVLVRKVCVRS